MTLLVLVYTDVDPVFCSGLTCEIYSGSGQSMYVYCVVRYQVMAVPRVRRVSCVFALVSTLVDDSEYP